MANANIFLDYEAQRRVFIRHAAGTMIKVPVSAFFSRRGQTVVVKSNYLRTRGTEKGRLLSPRKQWGKIGAHIKYVERRAEERTFYNEEGKEFSKEEVWEKMKEKDPYIVHRMVLSPGKDLKDEQFKGYVKQQMEALKERTDEGKSFDYFYAKHAGAHPHAHAILYSNNQFFIRKPELEYMRETGNEFIKQLGIEKVQEPAKEMQLGPEKEMTFGFGKEAEKDTGLELEL